MEHCACSSRRSARVRVGAGYGLGPGSATDATDARLPGVTMTKALHVERATRLSE